MRQLVRSKVREALCDDGDAQSTRHYGPHGRHARPHALSTCPTPKVEALQPPQPFTTKLRHRCLSFCMEGACYCQRLRAVHSRLLFQPQLALTCYCQNAHSNEHVISQRRSVAQLVLQIIDKLPEATHCRLFDHFHHQSH